MGPVQVVALRVDENRVAEKRAARARKIPGILAIGPLIDRHALESRVAQVLAV